MSLFDKFFRDKGLAEIEPKMDVVYVERSNDLVDLSVKENRADSVNYQGIGRTKYASGLPPAIYDVPLNAFNSYPVVRGVVTAIADAISTLTIKVYKVRGGRHDDDTKHVFHDVFRQPNPTQGSQEFLEEIILSLDLFGNCFIAIEKGSPVELYVLPAKNMAIIPDAKTKVKEYRYYINGVQTTYSPEEIVHLKYTDPDDPYYGASLLTAATQVLNLERNRLAFASAFFSNGSAPLGVLQTEQTVSETMLQKLRGEWTRLHQGVGNSSRVAILQGGLKYSAISPAIKDMDFKGLKELSNSDILSLYKTPAIILGDLAESSGEEGKAALTAWWRQTLLPRVKKIESALNRGLRDTVFGGGKTYFKFDLTTVEALSDSKVETAKYLSTLVSSSIMTPNECRGEIGKPPLEDGYSDQTYISNSQFGEQLIPTNSLTNVNANNDEKPTVKPKKDLDEVLYKASKKLDELTKYIKNLDD